MLNAATLCVTTVGTMTSFAAILAQFIGAGHETVLLFALLQSGCLAVAGLLAVLVVIDIRKTVKSKKKHPGRILTILPGWLIFILSLMIVTALLGDLSVILVRAIGHEVTGFFHLPSLCIVLYSIIYTVAYIRSVVGGR